MSTGKALVDLDKPIYETAYAVVTTTGTVVETWTDRDHATKRAKELGLRMVKTVREVE